MEKIAAGIRRIVAPNPSPMTGDGTCTYVVGTGRVAVIDPGPDYAGHIGAILAGLAPGEQVAAILVTHAHLDHSPGARALSRATGVPVHAFGGPEAGRSEIMQHLAATGHPGGGEGVDHAFVPDITLADGETLQGGDWELRALHTPGHFGNHLSFAMGDAIFTGDVVMGWSSTLISPPDGDLGDYFRSLARLDREHARVFYPGHGAPVTDPPARLRELADHRHDRTGQIMTALAKGQSDINELTDALYAGIAPALQGAARRNVFAHLIELAQQGHVIATPALTPDAHFARALV